VAASYQARADGASALARQSPASGDRFGLVRNAEAAARTAAAINPLDAQPLLLLGAIERAMGQPREAAEAYQAASRRAPTWSIPRYRLGEALKEAGDVEAAIAAYRAGLQEDPNATEILLALAKAQLAADRREEARATYERLAAVARSPAGTVTALEQMRDYRPAEAEEFLGSEAEREGREEAAVTHYEAAAKLLQTRRRETIAGGSTMLQLVGQYSPEEEERLWKLERDLWERLARLYTRRGDTTRAADARAAAADAAEHKPPPPVRE
jgi:tetratricopeptide (TPR) repeat protein